MAVCTLILPNVAETNGGVSNFGNHPSTVALYSLGFSLCALSLWIAGHFILIILPKSKFLTYILFFLGELYLLILLSTFPREYSFAYSRAHDYLGIALYAAEFVFSIWITGKIHRPKAFVAFFLTTCGMFVGLLSILKVVDLLFIGQAIGEVGFAIVLCTGLPLILLSSKTD